MLRELFDCVILGTGLIQSLLAGALGMQGKRVIHIDRNDFYGEYMSSHTLENFPTPSPVPENDVSPTKVVEEFGATLKLAIPTAPMPQLQVHETQPDNIGEQKAKIEAMEQYPVGTVVDASPFGLGYVAEYNDRGSAKVILDWSLAQYSTRRTNLASVYIPYQQVRKAFPGLHVSTSMGEATLWTVRAKDGVAVMELNWRLADGGKARLYAPQRVLLKSTWLKEMQSSAARDAIASASTADSNCGKNEMIRKSNRFSIDLTPRLLLCRGEAVDALVKSGVNNYVEFKSVDSLHIARCGSTPGTLNIQPVPCTKSDVFKSTALSMMDKRKLMKFIRFCSDLAAEEAAKEKGEAGGALTLNDQGATGRGRSLQRPQNKRVNEGGFEYEKYKNKPFTEFLTHCGLEEGLRDLVRFAIALVPSPKDSRWTTEVCIHAIQAHLKALGRFGETALLATLWGSAELPQAYCRLSAVNGGIYLLRKTPVEMTFGVTGERTSLNNDKPYEFQSVRLGDGTVIKGKCVIMGEDYMPSEMLPQKALHSFRSIARCTLVTQTPITGGENEKKSVIVLPPMTGSVNNGQTIFIVQLDEDSNVAPRGYFVVHLSMEFDAGESCASESTEVMKRAVDSLFAPDAVLWSSYFTQSQLASVSQDDVAVLPYSGVHLVLDHFANEPGNHSNLDQGMFDLLCFRNAFKSAKHVFQSLCPGQEFLGKPVDLSVLGTPYEDDSNGAPAPPPPMEDGDDIDIEDLDFDESLFAD